MLGGLVAAYLVARELPFLSSSGRFVFRDAGIVLIAGALICAVGVLDDLFELDALTKLGGQVLASGFLVAFGIQFYFFTNAEGNLFALDPAQRALLTGLLVVATINAVNMVDGLDGLAAGVVGVGALAFFTFCYSLTRLNGTVAGHHGGVPQHRPGRGLHRVPRAQLPSGPAVHGRQRLDADRAGALGERGDPVGPVLARTSSTGVSGGAQASLLPTLLPVLLPISLLVVPLADLVLAVVRRTRAGRSPMAADKQHLHHRLLEIGHSQRRAVFIMWLWAALIAFGTVLASLYTGPAVIVALSAGLLPDHRADLPAARSAEAPFACAGGRLTGWGPYPRIAALRDFVLLFTSTQQVLRNALDRTAANDDDCPAPPDGGSPRAVVTSASGAAFRCRPPRP